VQLTDTGKAVLLTVVALVVAARGVGALGADGPRQVDIESDATSLDVDLQPDGDATWEIRYRIELDDQNTTDAFQQLRTNAAQLGGPQVAQIARSIAGPGAVPGNAPADRGPGNAPADRGPGGPPADAGPGQTGPGGAADGNVTDGDRSVGMPADGDTGDNVTDGNTTNTTASDGSPTDPGTAVGSASDAGSSEPGSTTAARDE
jgi:hypothetical protein